MNKKGIYIYGVTFVMLLLVLIFLIVNNYKNYIIICGVGVVISFILLSIELLKNRSAEAVYEGELNRILKTYDAILSSIDNLPDLLDRSLVIVNNIEDLINAQAEIRKPIFYKKELESCVFLILDDKEACVFTLRLNDNTISPLDAILEAYKLNGGTKDSDILDGIDKTTIIRLENKKAFKVSPIRKKEDLSTEPIETSKEKIEEPIEEPIKVTGVTEEAHIKLEVSESENTEEPITEAKLTFESISDLKKETIEVDDIKFNKKRVKKEEKIHDEDGYTMVIPMLKDQNISDLTKEVIDEASKEQKVMSVSDEDLEKLINTKVKENTRKKGK